MELKNFTTWLNELLTPQLFHDYCSNGLCVEGSDEVTKVITGVSFRDRLIEAAVEEGADCIIVHHPNGFWNNENRILTGKFGERMRRLMKLGISLYGYHLPLDGHLGIGNNALIAKAMGLNIVQGFMQEGDATVGVIGEWDSPAKQMEFLESADMAFSQGVQNSFMFGSEEIKKVAICSGSGASGIEEALKLGCDAFVTGEIKESVPILVEEAGFNLISVGHHRSEVFGVRALAQKIEENLRIPAKFVDIDNPI